MASPDEDLQRFIANMPNDPEALKNMIRNILLLSQRSESPARQRAAMPPPPDDPLPRLPVPSSDASSSHSSIYSSGYSFEANTCDVAPSIPPKSRARHLLHLDHHVDARYGSEQVTKQKRDSLGKSFFAPALQLNTEPEITYLPAPSETASFTPTLDDASTFSSPTSTEPALQTPGTASSSLGNSPIDSFDSLNTFGSELSRWPPFGSADRLGNASTIPIHTQKAPLPSSTLKPSPAISNKASHSTLKSQSTWSSIKTVEAATTVKKTRIAHNKAVTSFLDVSDEEMSDNDPFAASVGPKRTAEISYRFPQRQLPSQKPFQAALPPSTVSARRKYSTVSSTISSDRYGSRDRPDVPEDVDSQSLSSGTMSRVQSRSNSLSNRSAPAYPRPAHSTIETVFEQPANNEAAALTGPPWHPHPKQQMQYKPPGRTLQWNRNHEEQANSDAFARALRQTQVPSSRSERSLLTVTATSQSSPSIRSGTSSVKRQLHSAPGSPQHKKSIKRTVKTLFGRA